MDIEVIKHDQEPYAFTIKKLGKSVVSLKDYADIMSNMTNYGFVKCAEYERDSQGKLHVHGIVLLRRGFFRKKLCMQGFHVKLEYIYDENGWINYITKCDAPDVNAKLFRNQYLFKD